MTGNQIYDLCKSILGNEAPSKTFMLQLINLARIRIESMRPWKVLSTKDNSLTVNGSNTYLTPHVLPTNLIRYLGESGLAQGSIVLFDGNDNIQVLTEVPIEQILFYKNTFGRFAVDYNNGLFYITGVVPGTFTIYQYYIQDTGTIVPTGTWAKFPDRFHQILAFDACARWRLGTDYDDVASRNAEDNVRVFDMLYEAMCAWDAELAIGAVNSIDYQNDNNNNSSGNYPGPRGVRANY